MGCKRKCTQSTTVKRNKAPGSDRFGQKADKVARIFSLQTPKKL